MKTESMGGPPADNVEERLAHHFTAELDRAERDYANLRTRQAGSIETAG